MRHKISSYGQPGTSAPTNQLALLEPTWIPSWKSNQLTSQILSRNGFEKIPASRACCREHTSYLLFPGLWVPVRKCEPR